MISKIGKNIKKIRSVKNINQQGMADILGLSRPSIGAYEEMRAEPKIESLIKLAKHFNLDLGRLINEDLTVNEIHGFKQAEDLVISSSVKTPIPSKPKKITYYILKNNKLKLQKEELNWPLATNKEVIAIQENANLCNIYNRVKLSEINLREIALVKTADGIIYNAKIVKRDDTYFYKDLEIEDDKLVVYQIHHGQQDVEQRLKRLENILSKLSL